MNENQTKQPDNVKLEKAHTDSALQVSNSSSSHPAALQLDPDVGMKTMNMLTRSTRKTTPCKKMSTTIS